jgi:hypothetical protein
LYRSRFFARHRALRDAPGVVAPQSRVGSVTACSLGDALDDACALGDSASGLGGRGRTEDDALGGLTNAAIAHIMKKGAQRSLGSALGVC